MNQEKIGIFIAERRKSKKMTQIELAEKLGVTNRSVSNWENGKNMPDLSLFQMLCDVLNITVNELLSGERISNPSEYQKKSDENIINTINYTNKKIKFGYKICLIAIFICFLLLVGTISYGYFNKEFSQKLVYDNASRDWLILKLSFHKNLDIQLEAINEIQKNNHLDLETKESLLYDFAQYHYIPILDYLLEEDNNKNLIQGFSNVMDFMANYNCLINRSQKAIFVKQKNKNHYSYDNGIYKYDIEKKVVDKSFFYKTYQEYLNLHNEGTVEKYFVSLLFKNEKLSEKYSFKQLEKEVTENYEDFYLVNRNIINSLIGQDLLNFSNYLDNFIEEALEGPILKRKIESASLSVSFELSKSKNSLIFSDTYFNNSYFLSLDEVWKKLEEQGYPKIYM